MGRRLGTGNRDKRARQALIIFRYIMNRHIKISWLIAGIFFLLLFATLTLHNFFTALTGKEDKREVAI